MNNNQIMGKRLDGTTNKSILTHTTDNTSPWRTYWPCRTKSPLLYVLKAERARRSKYTILAPLTCWHAWSWKSSLLELRKNE
jgi:hypothetical protein